MSAAPIRIVSPATGAFVGEVPDAGAAGAADAVARARAAQPEWEGLDLEQRVEALKRWRDAVLDEPGVSETLVAESGKPRQEAEGIEVLYFCELIRAMTRLAPGAFREETRHPLLFLTKKTLLVRRPLGVVAVIGPWNFPILNNAADAVAPLLAGNTVVLKPSEVTPLTSILLRDLWLRAGNPPDVCQVVTGRGATGAAHVDAADAVMFTGSVATGRRVGARCGERLVPCVLELGGKSPFGVLAGAKRVGLVDSTACEHHHHAQRTEQRLHRRFLSRVNSWFARMDTPPFENRKSEFPSKFEDLRYVAAPCESTCWRCVPGWWSCRAAPSPSAATPRSWSPRC